MKILISGASRGLGKDIAKQLSKEKHDLILLARNESQLIELKQDIESGTNSTVTIIPIDLAQAKEARGVFNILKKDAMPEVIINNVGVYHEEKIDDLNQSNILSQMSINLNGAVELTSPFIEHFKKQESGHIININSVMGLKSMPHATAYSMSKHALKAWSDSLREELRASKIKVTSLYPGAINTSSWDGIKADREAMIQGNDIAMLISTLLRLSKSTLVEEIKLDPLSFKP